MIQHNGQSLRPNFGIVDPPFYSKLLKFWSSSFSAEKALADPPFHFVWSQIKE